LDSKEYNENKNRKLQIYKKLTVNLINITDKEMTVLDDYLSDQMKKYNFL
jgi:hypothetical protein